MIKGSLLREKILIEKLEMTINMHRNDKSKYLLYIEPKKEEKLKEPINDELTELMEMALSKAKAGTSRYSHLDDMGDGWDRRKIPVYSVYLKVKKYHHLGQMLLGWECIEPIVEKCQHAEIINLKTE